MHPVQASFSNGNWLAIGTYKGGGAGNGGCPNDFDAKWNVYTDGELSGIYFCLMEDSDTYGAGDSPSFSITRGYCPSAGKTRWNFSMGGVLWACYAASASTANQFVGMLETTTTADWNIDVIYRQVEWRQASTSTWHAFGTGYAQTAPSYSNVSASDRRFNLYLGVLD